MLDVFFLLLLHRTLMLPFLSNSLCSVTFLLSWDLLPSPDKVSDSFIR